MPTMTAPRNRNTSPNVSMCNSRTIEPSGRRDAARLSRRRAGFSPEFIANLGTVFNCDD